MLHASPHNWLSKRYELSQGDRHLATLDLAWVREAGTLEIEGGKYELAREPGWGDFVMRGDAGEVCRAAKPSVLRKRFEVTVGAETFVLEPEDFLHRSFALLNGGATIGHISRQSFFSRTAVVDLPQRLPRPVQAFLTWLVLLMWRRQQRRA